LLYYTKEDELTDLDLMLYSASYILISLFAFYNFIDNPKLRKKTYICVKHMKYLTPDSTALEEELASCLLLFCFDVSDIFHRTVQS